MEKQYIGKKRQIQSYFYNKVTTNSNIVCLTGNNLNLHVLDFEHILNTPSKKAYVYDLSEDVINKFKYLEQDYPIELIHDNILNCKIERFMDIDLMATLQTTQGIIFYLFNEQYRKYNLYTTNLVNTFMFTYCYRNNRVNVEDLLNSMKINKELHIISEESISYRDGAPMCTVQIQWKRNI